MKAKIFRDPLFSTAFDLPGYIVKAGTEVLLITKFKDKAELMRDSYNLLGEHNDRESKDNT